MPDDQIALDSDQNPQEQAKSMGPNLLSYQNHEISTDLQTMVNTPADHELDPKDVEFLTMLMGKIDKGEIDLYRPATLLNYPVYELLNENLRGKADVEAFNLLSAIRDIRKLWNLGHRNTYQIENLAHRIRVTKERLEDASGDIYII